MTASLILQNGRILSADEPSGFVDALAVVDGRVERMGPIDDVGELRGPQTRVIDLAGRLAIPAFGDAHVHAISGGLESLRCNLLGLRSRTECLERIAAFASALPEDAWVLGGGWAMEAFPGGRPLAGDLDAVCGGRPAFLPNKDHHSAWVNRAALERASVDATTADPFAGRIERDEAGRPTGALHESAMGLVTRVMPPTTQAELEEGLRAALRHLHGHGITFWQDACVGSASDIGIVDTFDAYTAAQRDGWLTARVRGALWWDRGKGLEQLDHHRSRRESAREGAFSATSIKLMVDGVCETFTAAMSRAYLGEPGRHGQHRGNLFIEPEALNEIVDVLDRDGFQVHFHAIGDRAITTTLDALEGLGRDRWGVNRHHVAHLQFINPGDLARFEKTKVIANFQPLWACNEPQMEELTLPYVGEERAMWQYSIASLWDSGARVAFGSDWPVSSPDPIQEIHVAVNRKLSTVLGRAGTDETTKPFRPDQALTVRDALTAFTRNVAYLNGDEDVVGAITPGRRADVAVLSQNLFEIHTEEIGSTTVDLTIAAGQVVHGDE